MKIGFDISQTCESKSGTGFWADQLIRALSRVDKSNQYTLFPWFYDYRPQTVENATYIEQKNFRQEKIDKFSESELIKQLDIIHSNNFRFPRDTEAKKVVTIYDVCFMDCPQYTTEANRLFCYKGTLDSLLFADKIIAISEYTKQRLVHFFPFVAADKIEVVYCGNRDTLMKEADNISDIKKYKLDKEGYFLSVGTIEPRKNYTTLLRAYKLYKEKTPSYRKMCIAGGYGWLEENFKKKIQELGLEEDVIVTGYVSDRELANLYRYCFAFIYPTWYEGFGLPVLEAMNFNKPVLASKVTSIPEIVGESPALFLPDDEKRIAQHMCEIENSSYYSEIAALGQERIKKFSWDSSAEQIKSIYENLLRQS